MTLVEINFDGIVGPSHNYAGLSAGNLASSKNAGAVSRPRAAALQGIEKMRTNVRLGLTQGIFVPHSRPNVGWLNSMGLSAPAQAGAQSASTEAAAKELGSRLRGSTVYSAPEDHLQATAMSASAMWAANAATVSPLPDTHDGKCHLTPANLLTMPHRAHEWPGTIEQLRIAFTNPAFHIHGPVPSPFGDEGAANHMRFCPHHGAPGVEVFVYGVRGGPFPARQHIEASKAVARLHRVATSLFVEQSVEAIAAGAFHNDVVAVANENVLFTHEKAFEDKAGFYADLHRPLPELEIVEVPDALVSLADAIQSYLFNAQLVTLPGGAGMALILPTEAQDNARVWTWLEALVAGNGPIRRLVPVDIRESMANGGGPACLRLRVVGDSATVDPRFLVDEARLDRIAEVVTRTWPETIAPIDLSSGALIADIRAARRTLLDMLGLNELSD